MADRDRWRVVPAAGGVLWRDADAALESGGSAAPDTAGSAAASIEVALVHRPKYDDWSLPKGKLLPAEQSIVGGVREVAEETGITAMAGRPLGEMRYPVTVDGAVATKVVRYWAMRAQSGRFAPCAEVDQMQWLSPAEAAAALSYDHDRAPLQRLLARPYRTTTVLLVRHGRAGQRSAWLGPDRLRPLDATGQAQAQGVCTVAPCFHPQRVISPDLSRCVDTVAPLAGSIGVPVEIDPTWEEDAHAAHPDNAVRRVGELAEAGSPVVVCSQGGVIPDIIVTLAARDGVDAGSRPAARKGSMWALSFAGSTLVDAEYFPSLLVASPNPA